MEVQLLVMAPKVELMAKAEAPVHGVAAEPVGLAMEHLCLTVVILRPDGLLEREIVAAAAADAVELAVMVAAAVAEMPMAAAAAVADIPAAVAG
jgi:hypothetical protein